MDGTTARGAFRGSALDWPEVRREARPWTRWWWLGSAVSETEITRHLEQFRQAGIGGVEISPIYGAQGAESRAIPYLSSRWVEMLRHTTREGSRLGMGVDMILGTGWPYGGPTVSREDAAAQAVVQRLLVAPDGAITVPAVRNARLQALIAYGPEGRTEDLTRQVDSRGRLTWKAPGEGWSLYALQVKPTGQKVKRAGPGGEGNVLDHYSGPALQRWLGNFTPVLSGMPSAERPRALFNDSFEAFGSNWTPSLPAEFRRRRGYELLKVLPALGGHDTPDRVARVRSDYRQTISDLLLEGFTRRWAGWARGQGCVTRNQAHGSPGNVLDLYAAADIPETEMFGEGRRPVPPGTPAPAVDERVDDLLTCKLASSASHVAGKPYTSSESMTWLGEHFRVPLADVKDQADQLFLSGVNHLFYHGTPFSPADAEWPGWLFYASTHFAPTNTWWRDFPALNTYFTRCQSFLQAGRPDNDVLLYFPIWDLWSKDEGSRDLLQPLTVHNAEGWRGKNLPEFNRVAHRLWERGYGFDYVSDGLLERSVMTSDGKLVGRSGTYRVLVVAGCRTMPPDTFERIVRLAREGATVVVVGELPRDIPGLHEADARVARLRAATLPLDKPRARDWSIAETRVGAGLVLVGNDLERLLERARIPRERMTDRGLRFIRRVDEEHRDYFLANRSAKAIESWVPLAAAGEAAVLFDPMSGRRGLVPLRRGPAGSSEVYLRMEPGESRVVRLLERKAKGPAWPETRPAREPELLRGEWQLEFLQGGPVRPKPLTIAHLRSWTELPGESAALRSFSGTARYRLRFQKPGAKSDDWQLDLGDVRNSARVRLNGQDLGTLVAPPFRVSLGEALRPGENLLEVEVTNLMANRIAELDRRKQPWQKFFFVNIDYKKFDASTWHPLPSGLLGPVRLLPLGRSMTNGE